MSDLEPQPQNKSRRDLLKAVVHFTEMAALAPFAPRVPEKLSIGLEPSLYSLLNHQESRLGRQIRALGLESASGFGTYYGYRGEGNSLAASSALETPLVYSRLEAMVKHTYPADKLKKIVARISTDPDSYHRLSFKFQILYDLLHQVKDYNSAEKITNDFLDNSATPNPDPDSFNLHSLKGFCATLSQTDIGLPYFFWMASSTHGPISPVGWILPIDVAAGKDWVRLSQTTTSIGEFKKIPWIADLSYSCLRNFPPQVIPLQESPSYYTNHASPGIILMSINQLRHHFPSSASPHQPK